jgi:hypothetical protein
MPEMVKSSETKLFADDSLLFRTINNQAVKLRRINPNVLLPLPIVLSMCLSQVRLLEMVTHRNP